MDIKEIIDLVAFGIKRYQEEGTGKRFSLMEYYSITNISPAELAKIAYSNRMQSQGTAILMFSDAQYWLTKDIDIVEKLNHHHSFNNVVLTRNDKLAIVDKMISEEYPLLEGIYNRAAYYHAYGINFSKEMIKNKLEDAYYGRKTISKSEQTDAVKVLKK